MSFKVYQKFETTDVVSGKDNVVSSGFFPGGAIELAQARFTTSTTQTTRNNTDVTDVRNIEYYMNIYDSGSANPQVLFSIAYGDTMGSGSGAAGSSGKLVKSTKAVYSQYKNTLLGYSDPTGIFSFNSGSRLTPTIITSEQIIVLNFSSQLQRNQIDPGQWSLGFKSGSNFFTMIDDSSITGKNKQVYEIVPGSYDSNVGYTVPTDDNYAGLGLFYPRAGVMILNANIFFSENFMGGVNVNWSPNYDGPFLDLIHTYLKNYTGFSRMRKSEIIPSSHYFVRVKNVDFNFSNNPTFIYQEADETHSRGDILDTLVANPVTYITTVGLYNDLNELVAVAKLSRPTKKNFTNESLIRIRIDV